MTDRSTSVRTCVIVNPVAGHGRVERTWPHLRSQLLSTLENLTIRQTTAPRTATALTRSALEDGFDRIIALGGDGTLHEVVNGFFDADGDAIRPSAVLAPLLCGTGTDFRRALHLPKARAAIGALRKERIRTIDLLRIQYTSPDGRTRIEYAINVASFGLSSSVVQNVHRPGVRLPGARLQYFAAILRALSDHAPIPVDLSVDGQPCPANRIRLVAVANGPSFGAGIQIAPDAHVDDGQLDVTVIEDVPVVRLLAQVGRFYRGTHGAIDGVTMYRAREVQAQVPENEVVPMEADGELLGHLPAVIEVVPQCLRIQY